MLNHFYFNTYVLYVYKRNFCGKFCRLLVDFCLGLSRRLGRHKKQGQSFHTLMIPRLTLFSLIHILLQFFYVVQIRQIHSFISLNNEQSISFKGATPYHIKPALINSIWLLHIRIFCIYLMYHS